MVSWTVGLQKLSVLTYASTKGKLKMVDCVVTTHLFRSHSRPFPGSRIGAWDRVDPTGVNSYNQLWFIDPVDVADSPYDTRYTIRNLRSGTYMDLANSKFSYLLTDISCHSHVVFSLLSAVPYTNGATLVGRARGGDSQLWYIREEEHGFMYA